MLQAIAIEMEVTIAEDTMHFTGPKEFAVRWGLLTYVRSYIHKALLPQNNKNVKVDGRKTTSPQQRTIGNKAMFGAGEIILPMEEHTNQLFSTKWSALKTCVKMTLYRLKWLYLGIGICVCM